MPLSMVSKKEGMNIPIQIAAKILEKNKNPFQMNEMSSCFYLSYLAIGYAARLAMFYFSLFFSRSTFSLNSLSISSLTSSYFLSFNTQRPSLKSALNFNIFLD